MYTNLASLTAKFDLLMIEVNKLKPLCILISETHLNPGIADSIINIPHYSLFRKDRPGRNGGGIAVYVAHSHKGSPLLAQVNFTYTIDNIEALWLDIQIYNLKFLLACVYRPTTYTFEETDKILFDTIQQASDKHTTLIMGDFNLPGIIWPLQRLDGCNMLHEKFVEMYSNSNLNQLVTGITRKRNNQESLLDLVLCNDECFVTEVEILPNIGKSDHFVLLAKTQLSVESHNGRKPQARKRDYFRADYTAVEHALNQYVSANQHNNVEDLWQDFKHRIDYAVKLHIPIKQHRPGFKNKPWINKDILALINEKKKLWKTYQLNKNKNNYATYRNVNNKIVNMTRQARCNYESDIIDSGPKSFYSYLRKQISTKVGVPLALKHNGNLVTGSKAVADVFVDQFENTYVREPDGPLPTVNVPRVENSLTDIVFTPASVAETLNSFKDETAMGFDEIPAVLLKKCSPSISNPLARIMNKSFEDGQLPSDWKQAVVTPVYKKGSKFSAINYRPISLTSIVCKTMEKIIANSLKNFLKNEQIILDEQHGFVPGRSVVTNLLTCVNHWTTEWDQRQPTDVVYLDYEKAFDRVPIRRLLLKLEHFGIRGKLHTWLSDFLINRKLRVRVGDDLSENRPVHSGVPQGSVIGPIIFGIYLTDFRATLQMMYSLFADDAKIIGNPLTQHPDLQDDLDRITAWTQDWLLSLNVDKCSVLHIGKENPRKKYTIQGNALISVKTQRDLGVVITEDLKWEAHIITIVKRANSLLYTINKAFSHITPELFLKIYKTYVRPMLEYAYQIWSPYFKKDIDLLERVQRRATKMPTALRNKSYETRLDKLGLSTLQERRERGDLIETFKILNAFYNVPRLQDMFSLANTTNLRGHSKKLYHNKFKQNPRRHFLTNRVVESWNSLPSDVVNAVSVNTFKNKLDDHIKNKAITKTVTK